MAQFDALPHSLKSHGISPVTGGCQNRRAENAIVAARSNDCVAERGPAVLAEKSVRSLTCGFHSFADPA